MTRALCPKIVVLNEMNECACFRRGSKVANCVGDNLHLMQLLKEANYVKPEGSESSKAHCCFLFSELRFVLACLHFPIQTSFLQQEMSKRVANLFTPAS